VSSCATGNWWFTFFVPFGRFVLLLFSNIYMRFNSVVCAFVVLWLVPAVFADPAANKLGDQPCAALKNATVLVIRHAEKPAEGFELTPAGTARAEAYAGYFQKFQLDGQPLKLDHLFCAADSKGSHRPRLTIEPLSRALNLPLDNRFAAKNPEGLGKEIRSHSHGHAILICWHHGDIPAVLTALGADPAALLPHGKWPDAVFDWVIELRYDGTGRLHETHVVHEHLMPSDR
jgi:hypothetical protein